MESEDRFYQTVRESILLFIVTLIVYSSIFTLLRRCGPTSPPNAAPSTRPVERGRKRSYHDFFAESPPESAHASTSSLPHAIPHHRRRASVTVHTTISEFPSIFQSSTRPTLPFYICVFGLTASLFSIFLLPFTILANDLAHHLGAYTVWLDASLVNRTWDVVFIACHVTLYLAIPFAYFYEEEESPFGHLPPPPPSASASPVGHLEPTRERATSAQPTPRSTSLVSKLKRVASMQHGLDELSERPVSSSVSYSWQMPYTAGHRASLQDKTPWLGHMKEVLVLQIVLAFLLSVLLYMITRMLDLQDVHPLVLLNALSIVTTAILCLLAVPKGFGTALALVSQLALNPMRRHQLADRMKMVKMEQLVLQHRLQTMQASPSPLFASNDREELYQEEETRQGLAALRQEEASLRLASRASPFWRNLVFLFGMVFNTICWVLFMSQVAFHLLWTLWHRHHHVTSFSFPFSLFLPDDSGQGGKNVPPPPILATIELVQTLYFTAALLMGITRLPALQRIFPVIRRVDEKPKEGDQPPMTMHQFIRCTAICLILSTGLPVVIRILGISRYRLGGLYGAYMLFVEEGEWRKVAIIYRVIMMARATFVLVEAIHSKVWESVGSFLSPASITTTNPTASLSTPLKSTPARSTAAPSSYTNTPKGLKLA